LHVLRAKNATARTCGMFYKATVQAVLLYGSEAWNLSPTSVKQLEGFYIRAAWRMSGLQPEKKPNGSWSYPCSKDVLETAGLHTIAHYMDVRRQTVAHVIMNRPIWELCAGAVTVRRRGSPIRPFWWDQPMDLDLAKRRGACSSLRRALHALQSSSKTKRTEVWYGAEQCQLNNDF
jgi:hypothetical protein